MSYNYKTEKQWLFTNEGMTCFTRGRDKALELQRIAGAWNGIKALRDCGAEDTFKMMAILDYMVEMGDVEELTPGNAMGQHRVFRFKKATV